MKGKNLLDKDQKKIYQGFYIQNGGDVFYIDEKDPGEFYISNCVSEKEHRIVLPAMTENLIRIENPDRHLEELLNKSNDLRETAKWIKKILGPSYEPKKPQKPIRISRK